jgi:Tol biopolymer transport system component
VGSLDSKERTLILNANSNALYAPPGYLLYHREGTLMAQPFDTERIQLTGEPVPIAERVQFVPGFGEAAFTASETGVLAFRGEIGTPLRTLVWVNRTGREQAVAASPRAYNHPRLSPDSQRVAVEIGSEVWLLDLTRDGLTRFAFEGTENQGPLWTPDSKRIVFTSNKDTGGPGNLYWQIADGSGGLERLTTTSEASHHSTSLSPDGRWLVFHEAPSAVQRNIWVLGLSDRKAQPFLGTPFNEGAARFSPDGRWLAYVSNESGRPEIYVQPYPGRGGKWLISTEGGTEPAWNRNGRELFYRSGNRMMAVETTTQPSFTAGRPRALFEGEFLATSYPQLGTNYDVSADGQRFLMVKQGDQVPSQITVVQNWFYDLGRRVQTN